MRIPLSLGPPREDLDKSGDVCTVYDVVFHPDAVEGALKEEEFRSFVMQLTLHQIEQKYKDEVRVRRRLAPPLHLGRSQACLPLTSCYCVVLRAALAWRHHLPEGEGQLQGDRTATSVYAKEGDAAAASARLQGG